VRPPAQAETPAVPLDRRLDAIIRTDPDLTRLLFRLRSIRLPQWRLVAGCLYQTVWNVLTGRPRRTGIKDYDLIYFDNDDLSWEAEDAVIQRVAAATQGCLGPVEVRNQARVHLWFETRFGCAYPQLSCADEALRYYASVVHAIGVRLEDDGLLDIVAPFGLDDLFAMVIRPNRMLDNAASHASKARRALAIWPEIVVLPWEGGAGLIPSCGRDEATIIERGST
jgi:uncharacterized protein